MVKIMEDPTCTTRPGPPFLFRGPCFAGQSLNHFSCCGPDVSSALFVSDVFATFCDEIWCQDAVIQVLHAAEERAPYTDVFLSQFKEPNAKTTI